MLDKILSAIRSKPGINESEIAALLDIDPKTIYPMLEKHPDLIIMRCQLPIGGMTRSYRPNSLSGTENATVTPKEYIEIDTSKFAFEDDIPAIDPIQPSSGLDLSGHSAIPAPPLDLKSMIGAEPVKPGKTPSKAPLKSQKNLSRPDRAIAWLENNGSATSAQLKSAMGLTSPKHHPLQYLKSAIASGRVVYTDGIWSLPGNKQPPPREHSCTC